MALRRLAQIASALVVAASFIHPALAQDWPTKPVKVIVPFLAGGSTDKMGRVVADELSKTFKQQFYVENRVGAGGALGATQVARADADGYTLLIGGYGPLVLGPAVGSPGYDPLADFAHVAMIGGESYVLAVHASVGVKSLADLVAMLKNRSEPINCGSPGTGTLGQLMVEQLRLTDQLKLLNHVPYRGGAAQLTTDLLGNHVQLAMIPIASVVEHIKVGTVVPLAVSSSQRVSLLKDVPTFHELGYRDVGGSIWFWVAGPKTLPAPIVARLSQEVRRIVRTPELQQQFERDGLLSMDVDVAGLNGFIAGELKRWTAFIAKTGLKMN